MHYWLPFAAVELSLCAVRSAAREGTMVRAPVVRVLAGGKSDPLTPVIAGGFDL